MSIRTGWVVAVLGLGLGCEPGQLTSPPDPAVESEPAQCGDQRCDPDEDCASCAEDCGACPANCGDDQCGDDETCQTCPADCGACAATCGDRTCGDDETCQTCPADCGACAATCGDDACTGGESCASCPQDCGACAAVCGDGACTADEACDTCPQDCGACPPVCGDGACEAGETCDACPQDCGPCPPECGDGVCEAGETCDACPQDCGPCPPVCGDSQCEGGEACDTCPQDCGACDWPEALARSEEALLVMVNDQRAQGANCGGSDMPPVGPLTMNAELRDAARLHSQDMGENNYFSHTGLNGSSFSQRARDAGYRGFPAGENIAAGNGPAQATFNQWLNSPGHCVNMMRGQFREIGVGHAEVAGSRYRHYWTQVFGQ